MHLPSHPYRFFSTPKLRKRSRKKMAELWKFTITANVDRRDMMCEILPKRCVVRLSATT